jgi:hypothetical protein
MNSSSQPQHGVTFGVPLHPAPDWVSLWPPRRRGAKRRMSAESITADADAMDGGSGSQGEPKLARLSLSEDASAARSARERPALAVSAADSRERALRSACGESVESSSNFTGGRERDDSDDEHASGSGADDDDDAMTYNRGSRAQQRYAGYEGRGHFDDGYGGAEPTALESRKHKIARVHRKSSRVRFAVGEEVGSARSATDTASSPRFRDESRTKWPAAASAAASVGVAADDGDIDDQVDDDECCSACGGVKNLHSSPRVPGMAVTYSGASRVLCQCAAAMPRLRLDPRAAAFLARPAVVVQSMGDSPTSSPRSSSESAPTTLTVYSPPLLALLPLHPAAVPASAFAPPLWSRQQHSASPPSSSGGADMLDDPSPVLPGGTHNKDAAMTDGHAASIEGDPDVPSAKAVAGRSRHPYLQ